MKGDILELLNALRVATGFNACAFDIAAMKIYTDDDAVLSPFCYGCPHGTIYTCLNKWLCAPEAEGVLSCPLDGNFICKPICQTGVLRGLLLFGPIAKDTVNGEGRQEALKLVLRAAALLLLEDGMFAHHADLFSVISNYASQHMTEELTAETLSSALYVSESSICRTIREESGMPLRRYIQSLRLEAARALLLGTRMTVTQVAEKCGVNDFNYFARIFKKRFGYAPSVFRKMNAQFSEAQYSALGQ